MPLWKKKKAAEPAAPLDVLRWKIVAVNILFADTKEFEGAIYGHMIIELPNDPRQADKITAWLKNSRVEWREEV